MGTLSGVIALNGGGLLLSSATLTAGSFVLNVPSTAGLTAGTPISGPFLPAGAKIAGIQSGTSLLLSQAALISGTGFSFVTGNGNNYTGTTYVNAVQVYLGAPVNAVPGDLVISGGNTTALDAMPIANATVLNMRANQVADNATVRIRGGAQWNLGGYAETIGSLVFEAQGGSNGGIGPNVQTGSGTLSIAPNGSISAQNLDDPRVVATLNGNLSLPNALTFNIEAVRNTSVGGVNGQVGLGLNGALLSSSLLTKTGAGFLSLGGVAPLENTLNVAAGGVVLGPGSNYALTTISLATGTVLDMRGQSNLQLGGLTGTGTLKNFSLTSSGTLTLGADNANSNFDGTIGSEFSSNLLNIRKIGTGNWSLTADNAASLLGTLTVAGGSVTLAGGSARVAFQTVALQRGGMLVLDNSNDAVIERLGGATLVSGSGTTLQFQGGELLLRGSAGSEVSEAVATLAPGDGGGTLTLSALGTAGVTLSVGSLLNQSGSSSLLLRGSNLGAGLAAANTAAVLVDTLSDSGTQGSGPAGSTFVSIRPDILLDASESGLGAGFATRDAGGFLRPLAAGELLPPVGRLMAISRDKPITNPEKAPFSP